MKITNFVLAAQPFHVERTGEGSNGEATRVGMAIGWGLTTAGFAVPVFANAGVELNHGDRAVMGDVKLLIGLVEKEGQPLFEGGAPAGGSSPGPGRPPKPKVEPVQMGPHDIGFGDKSYKLVSSWHFKDGDTEFVFQVPGDKDVPDDARVTKINRDAYTELTKTVPVKDYESVLGIEKPGSAVEAPPESSDDEDDDVSDLV